MKPKPTTKNHETKGIHYEVGKQDNGQGSHKVGHIEIAQRRAFPVHKWDTTAQAKQYWACLRSDVGSGIEAGILSAGFQSGMEVTKMDRDFEYELNYLKNCVIHYRKYLLRSLKDSEHMLAYAESNGHRTTQLEYSGEVKQLKHKLSHFDSMFQRIVGYDPEMKLDTE